MAVLRIERLVKSYGKRRVVDKVTFQLNQGEVVGLLGPNGAGKTTTFYMIVGLITPDKGRIFLDGKDITSLAMYKRAREGIGYLPQEASVFRKLTVEENILAILQITEPDPRKHRRRLDFLLEEFNISRLAKNRAYTLSGGERRRVEISRALVTSPSFILLDEPFAGIDPIAVFDIQKIIFKLKEKGLGVLVTDHNVRETLNITDRAYIMHEGTILVSGSAEELAKDKKAKEIYLGEKFTL